MRAGFIIFGLLTLIVGAFVWIITTPTIWIWYPYLGIPNPLYFLRPFVYVIAGLGILSTVYGFKTKKEG